MCRLKVVLFAKGRGADASSYLPNRDESQWWGRRDALVRCVAAFLFGPSAPGPDSRELVLLYDEDWSRMHMKYSPSSSSSSIPVPKEQLVVGLWKRAASQTNGESVEFNGLSCRLVRSHTSGELPTGMDSKREILLHLQKCCSIDFLRKHGLNSSPAVILRKTNKQTLMKVWGQWKQKDSKLQSQRPADKNLESILKELLQPDSPSVTQVVAGTLHESSEDELPCWNQKPEHTPMMQLCLFLGAVRDMHSSENRCLERICRSTSVPLVGIRLGPVPEFTSKILSVIAFHHAERILGPAISSMVAKPNKGRKRQVNEEKSSMFEEDKAIRLHFVCLLPIESHRLTLELERRDRLLWCIVRCTVACLWRSRMVGQNSTNPLSNQLTLIFSDGKSMVLDQHDLVTSLAGQHQAAPSEYQILKALVEILSSVADPTAQGWKARSSAILDAIFGSQSPRPICLLDNYSTKDATDLVKTFYAQKHRPRVAIEGQIVMVLIPIRSDSSCIVDEMRHGFLKACRKANICTTSSHLLSTACQDQEACTITLLQHFSYQRLLCAMLQDAIDASGATRKKLRR